MICGYYLLYSEDHGQKYGFWGPSDLRHQILISSPLSPSGSFYQIWRNSLKVFLRFKRKGQTAPPMKNDLKVPYYAKVLVHNCILGVYWKMFTCFNIQKLDIFPCIVHPCSASINHQSERSVSAPVSLRHPSWKAHSNLIGLFSWAWARTTHHVPISAMPVFFHIHGHAGARGEGGDINLSANTRPPKGHFG